MLQRARQLLHPLAAALTALLLGASIVWAAHVATIQPTETFTILGNQCTPLVDHTAHDRISGACSAQWVSTPVPTATPVPDLIAGVLVCSDQDATVWHGTVKRDGAGAIVCTYGHEHGDDPQEATAVFGAPNSWYGGTQSISYPWHTPMENEMKHWFYKYLVRTNLQPLAITGGTAGISIRNIRAVGHLEGFSAVVNGMQMGFPAQVHSSSHEAEVCRASDGACGTVQLGGHVDYGGASLVNPAAVYRCIVPDINSPAPGSCSFRSSSRVHGGPDNMNYRVYVWYGNNFGGARIAPPGSTIRIATELSNVSEATGWIDENDLATLHQYPPILSQGQLQSASNGSWNGVEFFSVTVPAALDPDGDGLVTWSGYVDRWGWVRPATDCEDAGLPGYHADCIPVKIDHAPVGRALYGDGYYRAAYGGPVIGTFREHDVLVDGPNGRASLIRFPN